MLWSRYIDKRFHITLSHRPPLRFIMPWNRVHIALWPYLNHPSADSAFNTTTTTRSQFCPCDSEGKLQVFTEFGDSSLLCCKHKAANLPSCVHKSGFKPVRFTHVFKKDSLSDRIIAVLVYFSILLLAIIRFFQGLPKLLSWSKLLLIPPVFWRSTKSCTFCDLFDYVDFRK